MSESIKLEDCQGCGSNGAIRHNIDCLFEYFMSYAGFNFESGAVRSKLKMAYEHGANSQLPHAPAIVDAEPAAWISHNTLTGREHIGRLPVQSLQPGVYKHTKLYATTPKVAATPPNDHGKVLHASLCRRFGYVHDERNWYRDLVSLEEHIAKLIPQKSTMPNADTTALVRHIIGAAILSETARTIDLHPDQWLAVAFHLGKFEGLMRASNFSIRAVSWPLGVRQAAVLDGVTIEHIDWWRDRFKESDCSRDWAIIIKLLTDFRDSLAAAPEPAKGDA